MMYKIYWLFALEEPLETAENVRMDRFHQRTSESEYLGKNFRVLIFNKHQGN